MLAAAVGSYFANRKGVHAANEFSFASGEGGRLALSRIFLTMVPVLDYMQLHARDSCHRYAREILTGSPAACPRCSTMRPPTWRSWLTPSVELISAWKSRRRAPISWQRQSRDGRHFHGGGFIRSRDYIGNSPNFMIKAIAEQHGMHTPSFIGFVIKFSLPVLLPVLLLVYW